MLNRKIFYNGKFRKLYQTKYHCLQITSRNDLRRQPEFDPITFTFSENSNYWREILLEVIRQNIALLGDVNKLLKTKMPSNVLPLHLKQIFQLIIWIFTEGDGIESRLPFKIFSTLSLPILSPIDLNVM